MERFETQEREIIDINKPPRDEYKMYVNIRSYDLFSYDNTRIQEDAFKAEYISYIKWIWTETRGDIEFGRYIEYRLWFMVPCDNEYTEQRTRYIMEQRVRSMQYCDDVDKYLRYPYPRKQSEPKLLDDELFEVD